MTEQTDYENLISRQQVLSEGGNIHDVDLLLEMNGSGSKMESLGRYQLLAVILIIFTMNTGGYLFYGLAFYERIPKM